MNVNYQPRDNKDAVIEELIRELRQHQNNNQSQPRQQTTTDNRRKSNPPKVKKRTKKRTKKKSSLNLTLFLILMGLWAIYIIYGEFTKPLPSESVKIATTVKK